jgi:hypothetical protein
MIDNEKGQGKLTDDIVSELEAHIKDLEAQI